MADNSVVLTPEVSAEAAIVALSRMVSGDCAATTDDDETPAAGRRFRFQRARL